MKPKTPLEKKIVELSAKLRPITPKQKAWAFANCLENRFARSRNTLFCLECGHSWKDTAVLVTQMEGCTCPSCGKDLKEYNARESCYYATLTTKSGFQVVRMFWVEKTYHKNSPACEWASEVMQHWIDESGKVITLSKSVQGMSMYFDAWCHSSELELRGMGGYRAEARYNLEPFKVYPDKNILPILKRNGFKGRLHDLAPQKLFSLLLTDSIAETLLKSGQIKLLQYYCDHSKIEIQKWWSSIKICIRNGYTINDGTNWLDYMDMLEYFGKDVRSPLYVCPDNFEKVHNKLLRKKRDIEHREKIEEMRKSLEADQKAYESAKKSFFGINFKKKNITVKVFESVEELMREADLLHHCAYSNKYHKKKGSLMLSARVNNEPIETVELQLSNMKVVQCRGLFNKPSGYHDQIVNLVNSNVHLVRNAMKKSVSV